MKKLLTISNYGAKIINVASQIVTENNIKKQLLKKVLKILKKLLTTVKYGVKIVNSSQVELRKKYIELTLKID